MAYRKISSHTHTRIQRYLALKWTPAEIAKECRVSLRAVYYTKKNLLKLSQPSPPPIRKLGRPSKITDAALKTLEEQLLRNPYAPQLQMVRFLKEEFGIVVSQMTISNAVRKIKKGTSTSETRSDESKSKGGEEDSVLGILSCDEGSKE